MTFVGSKSGVRVKVRVKCPLVLALEQSNSIVNALCTALAHNSKTIEGGELKKAFRALKPKEVCLYPFQKTTHLLLRAESPLKNASVLFLISYSP